MTDQAVARRYAQVLYDEAEAGVRQDMELVRKTLEGSRDLRLCLASPVVPRKKKLAVLEAVFGDQVQPVTLRLVRLLLGREREDLLLAVTREFDRIRDAQLGITRVHARVALALAGEEQKRLQQVLAEKLGTGVRMDVAEDASLIGGAILRIGDIVYDGSVAHQLAQLRSQIH